MKRIFLLLAVFTLFFVFSCRKEQIPTPVCTIVNLQAGQEFCEDEDIPVYVTVDDNNSVITSVLLYIDNKSYTGTSEFPYNFTIKAGDLLPGTYTIKVIAKNKAGKQGEFSVIINVKEVVVDMESPDFVSFSDRKLPRGWEANGWYIDPSSGYDDSFSLYSGTENATVKAHKTCDYIEFYLNGLAKVNFYIDDELKGTLQYNHTLSSWKKVAFSCQSGFHTFKWVFITQVYTDIWSKIDAVSFIEIPNKTVQ